MATLVVHYGARLRLDAWVATVESGRSFPQCLGNTGLAPTSAFEADGPQTLHPRPRSVLQFTQNLIINGDNSSDDARGIGCHQLRARTHPTKELCEHTALASHDRDPSARLWQGTGKSATRRPFSRSSALNLPRVTSALLIASASSWARTTTAGAMRFVPS